MKNHLCEFKDLLFFDLLVLFIEVIVYSVSLGLPAYLLFAVTFSELYFLVLAIVFAFFLSCFIFIFNLTSINRLIPKVNTGQFFRDDVKTLPHSFKTILKMIMERSPFFNYINSFIFFRLFYFRGMGAKMDKTVYIAPNVRIDDPWGLQVGADTVFGHSSMVLSHVVEGNQIYCDHVKIGKNVLIGARSVIMPGVVIGDNVIIAANSVVTKGCEIKSGETWGGVPAKLISKQPIRIAIA